MQKAFAQAWRDYRLLLCIGLLYGVLCTWQAFEIGVTLKGYLGWAGMTLRNIIKMVYVFVLLVVGGAYLRAVFRSKWNAAAANRDFGVWFRGYLSGDAFAAGCLGLLAAYESVFFILQKATVRWLNPYPWDQDFERWDKALHFGRHPFEYLLDWFGGKGFDGFFQFAYIGWFGFMYLALGYCLFVDSNRLRKLQFVWVFLLGWILLGGFGATILASVCPVYYHHFYPHLPDVYKPLTDYIAAHAEDIKGIVYVQKALLDWHYKTGIIIPNGIAAMPSMHAAISTLVVLYTWAQSRIFAVPVFLFAVSIVVSSIYFGFHYAIDSYFSIICVSLMWWGTGRMLRWRMAEKQPA